jgi:hypothetical protein
MKSCRNSRAPILTHKPKPRAERQKTEIKTDWSRLHYAAVCTSRELLMLVRGSISEKSSLNAATNGQARSDQTLIIKVPNSRRLRFDRDGQWPVCRTTCSVWSFRTQECSRLICQRHCVDNGTRDPGATLISAQSYKCYMIPGSNTGSISSFLLTSVRSM